MMTNLVGLNRKASETIFLTSVYPEMVDFGFWQGPNEFSTTGIASYSAD